MSNSSGVVPADIIIDETGAQKLIRADFPQVKADSITLIGEGWDNLVFLVDNHWVFRFPRRRVAVPLLEQEIKVLHALRGQLPLEIPNPAFLGTASTQFSAPFYGHAQIIGTTGCKVSLSQTQYGQAASKLAVFLRTLHSIKLTSSEQSDIGAPHFNRLDFPRLRASLGERQEPLRLAFGADAFDSLVERLCEGAKDYASQGFGLIHGDLYDRHLIFNDRNELSGVIDFGDAGMSDPVIDLGVVYQFFPPDAHSIFFETYGSLSESGHRYARFLALYSAVCLYWYGNDRDDESLQKSGLVTCRYLHLGCS